MPLPDRLTAALTHWLNGEPGAAAAEGFTVDNAIADLDRHRIVVTFEQTTSANTVRAVFALMGIEMPATLGKAVSTTGSDSTS